MKKFEFEIDVVVEFDSEEDAKLIYFSMYPDMRVDRKDIKCKFNYKNKKINLKAKTYSLAQLRGFVNSFLRAYRVVKDII